jgi:acetylornithine/N-succinyldiaminopimelate aminotransferase
VRALTRAGRPSVGISGNDAECVRATLLPELGRVGIPELVSVDLLYILLDAGFTPVLSPVSQGPDGEAVNVNADEVAGALATALQAERLFLISDVDGVHVRGQVRPFLAADEVEPLITSGEVSAGMIPKLRAAALASHHGVTEVWIRSAGQGDMDLPHGTRVSKSPSIPADFPEPLRESDVLAGVVAFPRLMLERGKGSRVWDTAGRSYLDFSSGLGVAALGHGREDLATLLRDQFRKLGHCSNLYGNRPALELAHRLVQSSFATRVWFANSGTEANEAALKFARLFGHEMGGAPKHEIVAMKGGFHGRTAASLAATYHPEYRLPFEPLWPGVRFAAFNDLEDAARVIHQGTCAVLVEPVQGEGGVIPATSEYLEGLRALCDRHDALLIFDEVQCGLGRLGHVYAYEAYGVMPDMITLAKPLAAGFPLGAVLIGERVAPLMKPGQHGSTFAGGPAGCALGLRVLDEVSRPEFLRHVRMREEQLRTGLDTIASTSPLVESARGRGLLQALVLSTEARLEPPDIIRSAREAGLLLTRAGDRAIRFLPPLNVSENEVDLALDIMRRVVADLVPAPPLSVSNR